MATDTTRWPWIFDSADIGALPRTMLGLENSGPPWASFGATFAQRMALGTVNWVDTAANPMSAGDQVILQDLDGKEIWRSKRATGADDSDQYKFPDTVPIKGLVVFQLPSGLVELHFR